MNLFRVLSFFLAFTLEVRVHASETANKEKIWQQPENCLQTEQLCAFRLSRGKFSINTGKAMISVTPESTVVRVTADTFRVVEGKVWIQSKGFVSVESEYGLLKAKGSFWVERIDEKVYLSNVSGEAFLYPRGHVEVLAVEIGQRNWISEIRNGKATSGFPEAIPFTEHVRAWSRLYSGKKERFVEELRAFRKVWFRAVREVSRFHRETSTRYIATINEKNAERAKRRRKIQVQEKAMRDLFRQRNGLDPARL